MKNHPPADLAAQQRMKTMGELLARFSWPIEEEFMRDAFEVRTDFAQRKHVVYWPRQLSGREPSFKRYLHEMGHALLGEQVHPQFSRPVFCKNQETGLLATYQAVFDAALDWFVEGLLMEVAPTLQGPDIDERFRQAAGLLRQGMALPSVSFVVDTGMSLASFKKHRGLDMDAKGKLAEVIRAFSRTAPDKPTLFTLQGLTRSLVELFELHTASLEHQRGFEAWRLRKLGV